MAEIDLAVGHGEILALVGESGSGKTTLLHLAAGLETPDDGEVRIAGQCVAGPLTWVPPEKRGVGLVLQSGALFPHLTVAVNVAYGLHKLPRNKREAAAGFMLAMTGLTGKERRFPHELSGGERQRLALARALAPRPTVVLLDEPFSSLDPALRRALRADVRGILRKVRATAILVTHDPDDALALADRIAILREGRLVQTGTPAEVYRNPEDEYCARLFGPVNIVPCPDGAARWVRPEQMRLRSVNDTAAHCVKARVERVHDAGRHLEVAVRRLHAGPADVSPEWILHAPPNTAISSGQIVDVMLPENS